MSAKRKWSSNLGLGNHSNVPLISRSFSEGLGYGFGFGGAGVGVGLPLPISVPGRAGSIDGFGGFGNAVNSSVGNFGLGTSFGAGGVGGGGGLVGVGEGAEDEIDFLLVVSSDEKLLTRLNEIDGSETVSTSGKGTDAKWRLEGEEVLGVLRALQVAGGRGSGGRVVWV